MLLLTNGVLATMDPARPLARAAVVDGAYFAYVGEEEEARAFVRTFSQEPVEELNLEGRSVLPGFHDSHMHVLHLVKARQSVDLFHAVSLAQVQERLRERLPELSPASDRWLMGEGWNQEQFTDCRRFPNRQDLDAVSWEVPILILRGCFHVGVVNSLGLEKLGITRENAGAYGDFLELDETGEPTGVLKENLLDDVKGALPSLSLPRLLDEMVQTQHDLLAEGLTSIQSDDFKYAPDEDPYALMEGLRNLAERGRLKLRMGEQALLTERETLEDFFRRGMERFGGSDNFRISAVKLLADGSLGARTAYLQAPYADDPGNRGIPIYRQEELDALVETAHRHNFPVDIHAIGDGGAEMALTAFQRAQERCPWLHPRHGLVHCQVMTANQLRRMEELEVSALVQPVFLNGDMHIAPARLGEARLAGAYAWGSMAAQGIPLAFGTDCPVEPFRPLDGIYCAVTRRDFQGRGPFLPSEAVSVEQALYAYTVGSAYAAGEEHRKGQLRPGMLADFVVLDRNLLTIPLETLREARVLRTYVGGVCVYSQ